VESDHLPVMVERCVALLAPALGEASTVIDATVGLGGHSAVLLQRCPHTRLIGLDRDPQALSRSARRLAEFEGRVTLVSAIYDELPRVLSDLGIDRVQGILFDLGVSSLQLNEADRGFGYSQDGPLDMRMDPGLSRTAADVVNTYPAADLARLLRRYSDERFARRIAAAIVRERANEPLSRTSRLAELVREAIPAATRRTGGHPAKRTFQALRIEVNDELGALRRALPEAVKALAVGGRMVVMSYQSLEDAMVKRVFTAATSRTDPVDLPVELPEHAPRLRLLTRGAERPSDAEIEANPRASAARLRAVERMVAA
jgi:16S rRNA (cytosine1402-N4)-methyltransferase